MPRRFNPRTWAGFVPNGLGEVKPNHYGDMLKVLWRNRDELPYAARILRDGTCDGCALGTVGVRDWTLDGVHLCMVRLNLLRLNTMGALDPALLADVAKLPGARQPRAARARPPALPDAAPRTASPASRASPGTTRSTSSRSASARRPPSGSRST